MLVGKKVILRLFKEEDLEEYVKFNENVMQLGKYWFGSPMSLSKTREEFKKDNFWTENHGAMAITDKEYSLVGKIFFFKSIPYNPDYEIGYQIFNPQNRNKGTMTEALKIFSSYLFALKRIERLQLCAIEENIPSIKVAEKCGFKREGILRKAFYMKGKYHNMVICSLLREECTLLDDVIEK